MHAMSCRLLGRFEARHHGQPLSHLRNAKARELFCWLLLNGNRPHHREVVASHLWGDVPTPLARKYLRQALWHLQIALRVPEVNGVETILVVDTDWISLSPDRSQGLWVDVFEFQDAFDQIHGIATSQMTIDLAEVVRRATELYCGDLLEGWYQDWCHEERERLKSMCIVLLDKLATYWESRSRFDLATSYAGRILQLDRADERAHRRLMRMQCVAGDRRAALRQYDQCRKALADELGVEPSRSTETLYQVVATFGESGAPDGAYESRLPEMDLIPHVLEQLEELRMVLDGLQARILAHAAMSGGASSDTRSVREVGHAPWRVAQGEPFHS